MFTSLSHGSLKPIGVVIQLANRSTIQPTGLLEDVLIQVNKLIFSANFYILDMGGEDLNYGATTIILGKPFLKIARTKIDVHAGTPTMEFGDNLVQFNILDAMKHPVEDHSVYHLDILGDNVDDDVLGFLGVCNILDSIDWTDVEINKFISSDVLNYSNFCDAGFATETYIVDAHLATLDYSNPNELQVVEVSLGTSRSPMQPPPPPDIPLISSHTLRP